MSGTKNVLVCVDFVSGEYSIFTELQEKAQGEEFGIDSQVFVYG